MEWNLTTFAILLGVLFAGYGIGLLEMYLKQSKKIKRAEEALQALQQQQSIEKMAAAGPGHPNALCLWFDTAKNLNLEVDGMPVESPRAATSEQRRRLVTLLTQLRPWVEGGPVAPAAPQGTTPSAAPRPQAAPRDVDQGVQKAADKTGAKPPEAPPSLSIVTQIDDILQKRLKGTPLAGKIRLQEGADGSVEVWVGVKRYDGIDKVLDPEVQTAIRQAVEEWERSR